MPPKFQTMTWLATLGLLLVLGFKYLFPVVAPFLIGLTLAYWVEPVVKRLVNVFKIKRGLVIGFILLILTLTFLVLTALTVLALYQEAESLLPEIPKLVKRLYAVGNVWLRHFRDFLPHPNLELKNLSTNPESVNQILRSLIGWIMSFLPELPKVFFTVGLGGVTAYFFSRDKQLISLLFYRNLPSQWQSVMMLMKEEVFTTVARYLLVECLLALITGTITAVFFKIIGIPGAFTYGVLAGLLDLIPVLGAGMIYFPIAAIYFLFGQYSITVWITVGYFVVLFIRQLAEIKLIGENLNIHPLLAVFAIYVGMKFFGFTGFFLGPIILIILRSIYRALVMTKVIPNYAQVT